jgi:hypothetical protein
MKVFGSAQLASSCVEFDKVKERFLAVLLCMLGVAPQTIDVFMDEELDKRTFVEIVMKRTLQRELSELKTPALHARAKGAGACWRVPLKGCMQGRLGGRREVCCATTMP